MSNLTPTHRNSGIAPNNPPAFQFSFPIGLAALWDERFINHAETKQCPFTADSWHCVSDLLNGKVVDTVHLLEIKNRDWWGDQKSVVVFSRTQSVCAARRTFVPPSFLSPSLCHLLGSSAPLCCWCPQLVPRWPLPSAECQHDSCRPGAKWMARWCLCHPSPNIPSFWLRECRYG